MPRKSKPHCPRCASEKVKGDDACLTCEECNYVGPRRNPNQPQGR